MTVERGNRESIGLADTIVDWRRCDPDKHIRDAIDRWFMTGPICSTNNVLQ